MNWPPALSHPFTQHPEEDELRRRQDDRTTVDLATLGVGGERNTRLWGGRRHRLIGAGDQEGEGAGKALEVFGKQRAGPDIGDVAEGDAGVRGCSQGTFLVDVLRDARVGEMVAGGQLRRVEGWVDEHVAQTVARTAQQSHGEGAEGGHGLAAASDGKDHARVGVLRELA